MRLVIEINSGRLAHHKVVLQPGDRVSFGRSGRAELSVAHDGRLSARHFEVLWDGVNATVVDLNSRGGTMVDGELIHSEVSLGHCSWIRAGLTDWTVYHELETVSLNKPQDGVSGAATALKQLRPLQGSLFAVLDGARDDRIRVLLHESVDSYRSLFDGLRGDAMADVAPYVVKLREDSQLLQCLLAEGWGRRWGLFVTASGSLTKVRRHLRRFLMVKDDATEEELYFRYYDPDVMDTFADVITARQRAELLTELSEVLWERPDGSLRRLTAEPT